MKTRKCSHLWLLLLLVLKAYGNDCYHDNNISVVKFITLEDPTVDERIDCHPEPVATRERCERRGCIFDEQDFEEPYPECYYPQGYGYEMVGEPTPTKDGYMVHLRRTVTQSMFGGESQDLYVQVFMQNNKRLRISVTDNKPNRFKVPIDIPSDGVLPPNPDYVITFTSSPTFGIQVTRRSTGESIIDTSLPGFVYSDQYLQLPMRFPKGSHLYGWGENEQYTFAHNMNWTEFGLYGRDQPPDGTSNMYGVHPRLTLLDKNGDAAGILFLNSAAQEISLTPMPGAVYRTIGGTLDVYIFLGPTPEEVVEQYTLAVGRTPIPPYWGLGFHLCRYGYNNLTNMQAARDRMVEYKIPQDAQWGDIDIMDRQLDFTVDPVNFGGLAQYVKDIKQEGVKFVTILDPCISIGEPNCSYKPFDLGEQFGVWVQKPDGQPVVGRVWPDNPVYFPDYTNQRTHEWWKLLIVEFHDLLEFDGLWIDMNEPANFVAGDLNDGCATTQWNHPPYIPHIRVDDIAHGLADKTLCGDAVHSIGRHYDVHNMFGWSQSQPTLEGVREATGKRGLVLSRSTFVGSGQWVAHWLGDNFSNWQNLKNSIIGMLQFNQFGIPFVGADICGFIGNTNPELCARWQQLGAFYPFSRNHNALGSIEQDPGVFGEEVARITRNVLNIRYTLLPYLYTLFYQHYTQGGTVARALWHEFPTDSATWRLDDQFLWGPWLLISPVLEEGATSRSLYLPTGSRWYKVTEFLTWNQWEEVESGDHEEAAPLDSIPLHLRGGAALPLQLPALNTELSRSNPFQLVFALDEEEKAQGTLFYDDGDSLNTVEDGVYLLTRFGVEGDLVALVVDQDGWRGADSLHIQDILIIGLKRTVTEVLINGVQHPDFVVGNGQLTINQLELPVNKAWEIQLK